jgi:multicomponent Na+:H+ antiporter subunit D
MSTLVPLPLALPLLVAALFVGASPLLRRSRRARDLLATLTMAGTTVLAALLFWRSESAPLVYWFGGWVPRDGVALGIAFQIDPVGASLATLTGLLSTAALVFSWHYFKEIRGLFYALFLIFGAAMVAFSLTGDLFNLFVLFELMGVAAFALTCYLREAPSLEGSLNFAITNSIGAFLVLMGIALLYARTGALNMAQIGAALAGHGPDGLVVVACALLFTGFLVKAAAVPFHFWLPDAHAVAPTPVCVLFSGIMVELGLYAVARIYWTSLADAIPPEGGGLRVILTVLGALTAVLGGAMCFLQRHLKRLLAFSTVSHSGVMLVGLGLLDPGALGGMVLYLWGHGMIKGALFMGAGVLIHREASVDEFELRGKGKALKPTGILFALAALALAGVPPFALFRGKSVMEEAAGAIGYTWVAWVFLLSSILTGGAVLRAAGRIFLGLGREAGVERHGAVEKPEKETHGAPGETPFVMIAPIAALVVLSVLLGVAPRVEELAEGAAHRFQGRDVVWAVVLHGAPPSPLSLPPAAPTSTASILYGVGGAVGAILLAIAALTSAKWSAPHPVARLADIISIRLQKLHSGHVGDYVAWIVIGVAVLGGLFALVLVP